MQKLKRYTFDIWWFIVDIWRMERPGEALAEVLSLLVYKCVSVCPWFGFVCKSVALIQYKPCQQGAPGRAFFLRITTLQPRCQLPSFAAVHNYQTVVLMMHLTLQCVSSPINLSIRPHHRGCICLKPASGG